MCLCSLWHLLRPRIELDAVGDTAPHESHFERIHKVKHQRPVQTAITRGPKPAVSTDTHATTLYPAEIRVLEYLFLLHQCVDLLRTHERCNAMSEYVCVCAHLGVLE